METDRDFGFFNRRLHSLLGIMPVGLFLLEHFFTNSFAWHGATAYNEKIEFFQSLPYLLAIEIAFIFLPLLFHGIYGLYIVWTGKQNVLSYGYARNWMYFIQRVTGVILILFIGWHLWTTRLSNLFFGTEVSYDLIHNLVTSPITFWWMVLGIVSASFHLANGLWSFCIVWGITIGPKAQERMGYLTIGLWLILSFVGVRALYAFV